MTAILDRHDGRHVVLFDRDYRWHLTNGRWTLRPETDRERYRRIHTPATELADQ